MEIDAIIAVDKQFGYKRGNLSGLSSLRWLPGLPPWIIPELKVELGQIWNTRVVYVKFCKLVGIQVLIRRAVKLSRGGTGQVALTLAEGH